MRGVASFLSQSQRPSHRKTTTRRMPAPSPSSRLATMAHNRFPGDRSEAEAVWVQLHGFFRERGYETRARYQPGRHAACPVQETLSWSCDADWTPSWMQGHDKQRTEWDSEDAFKSIVGFLAHFPHVSDQFMLSRSTMSWTLFGSPTACQSFSKPPG